MESVINIRTVFRIIAFGVFLFQMMNSISKYLEKPVFIETSKVSRNGIKEPFVYICGQNVVNYTAFKQFGYTGHRTFLLGQQGNNNYWQFYLKCPVKHRNTPSPLFDVYLFLS